MALNIKPFFPKTHPIVFGEEECDLSLADESEGEMDLGPFSSGGGLSEERKEEIKNISKDYYKKLLDVL